jgi:hypothetical protein
MSDAQTAKTLQPVSLPDDIHLERTVDREALKAKLRAKTSALSQTRQKKRPQTQERINQAVDSIATSVPETASVAQQGSAAAQTLIRSMNSEKLADMIQQVVQGNQIPDSLKSMIPPEARNLSRKDLIKVLKRM